MVKQITVLEKKRLQNLTHLYFFWLMHTKFCHDPIRLRREKKAEVLPMQRSLCSVSPDAEKGLRYELHYLLVDHCLSHVSDSDLPLITCSKKVQSIAMKFACLVI